ncbi:MAG: GTPase [Acidobacteriota bacterium]|nr:MAG: GTPase [Acidobacteriota bacterium]
MSQMRRKRILILGAAGRDFHNFNVAFRDDESHDVIGFTATQIPNIDGRRYPAELAGRLYPQGIPIWPESQLEQLIGEHEIDEVVFAYSDVAHEYVMHLASRANAAGADFSLLGASSTMIPTSVPVISVCAVRTGCGKSQTSRRIAQILLGWNKKVVVIRHPMPYGNLAAQRVQRFETLADLDKHECTIEEREEYEPHISKGIIVYAGVDYGEIARQAEQEAEVIVWDGGNNDLPFLRPSLEIVVTDPHRPGHELSYYPGETNFRRADVIVINKLGTAPRESLRQLQDNIRAVNPAATIVEAASPISAESSESIAGKRVLVIEDGPTLTHGGMSFGAGMLAAEKYGAAEIVDPRPHAVGSIKRAFENYPQTERVLPALGYGAAQIAELSETIRAVDCELVLIATPIDLRRMIDIDVPALRVTYELEELGSPTLAEVLARFR